MSQLRTAEEILNSKDKSGVPLYWQGVFGNDVKINRTDVIKAINNARRELLEVILEKSGYYGDQSFSDFDKFLENLKSSLK